MMTRDMEESIRQIVREEIAADEMRRIAQERTRPRGGPVVDIIKEAPPGTILLSAIQGSAPA